MLDLLHNNTFTELISGAKSREWVHQKPTKREIPVFLGCPDLDPMHSPKIGYNFCSQ